MSDSIQYRAIQSILDQLVKAVTSEIDSIFPKAWNSIIKNQKLSIGPNSSPGRKAEALVSAIAAEVAKDITVFDKFLAILREYPKLADIVELLEVKVSSTTMSKESSKSLSTGASESPKTPRARLPLDGMPKLAPAEQFTKESGFGGELTNPSPIAPEPQDAADAALPTGGAAVHIHRLLISEQTKQVLREDGSSFSQNGSASNHTSTESSNNDENLPVLLLKDENAVPVSEASGSSTQYQELVLPSSQEDLSSDLLQRESEQNKAEKAQLKKELKETKLNEAQLKKKVEELIAEINKLQKEKEDLEKKLHQKVAESKKTNEEQAQHIARLKSELKKKEVENASVKKRLAEAEKQNEVEIKKLKESIKKLEKERKDLTSDVTKLQDDQKIKDLESREKIVTLREDLSKKTEEESKRTKELAAAQMEIAKKDQEIAKHEIEIANKNTDIANQEKQLVEQKREMEKNNSEAQIQKLKNNSEAQIQKLKNNSEAQIQKLKEKIDFLENHNKVTGNEQSSQTTPTSTRPPPNEQQSSETTQSSIERESSQTESTGAPSRNASANDQNTANETDPPSDSPSRKVLFEVVGDDDSTQDLSSKAEAN